MIFIEVYFVFYNKFFKDITPNYLRKLIKLSWNILIVSAFSIRGFISYGIFSMKKNIKLEKMFTLDFVIESILELIIIVVTVCCFIKIKRICINKSNMISYGIIIYILCLIASIIYPTIIIKLGFMKGFIIALISEIIITRIRIKMIKNINNIIIDRGMQ